MAARSRPRLGELMVRRGLITSAQLEEALRRQRGTGKPLGEILVEMGATSAAQVRRSLELQHQVGRGKADADPSGEAGHRGQR